MSALPYARHSIGADDVAAVADALRSERVAQGPRAEEFARAIADEAGTRHAVAVSSGTAALHTALAALGVGPGDEVVVPTLTFAATANAVALCGATPRFADVDPATLNLDAKSLERCLGPRTRGAIAVHYAGHPADVPSLVDVLGDERFLLEDASHALGASLAGTPAGALGSVGCFSFHPAKAITSGEGGALTTDSDAVFERALRLREHGIERRPQNFSGLGLPARLRDEEAGPWVYEMHELASNYRISEPAAALGMSQLQKLHGFVERRRKIAEVYRDALADFDRLELPAETEGARSAWHLFPVRLRADLSRAAAFAALHARGVQVQVHYIPVHLHPYYRHQLGTAYGDFPVAEDAYLRLLSLPLFPGLTDEDVVRVVDVVRTELSKPLSRSKSVR